MSLGVLQLLALTFALGTDAQGFDWGSGCEGGSGIPFSVTLPEGQTATVGTIPPGKYAVRILLSSSADVVSW